MRRPSQRTQSTIVPLCSPRVGVTEKPTLPTIGRSSSKPPLKGRRKAYVGGKFVAAPIYDGPKMRVGHRVKGPAIVEEPFTRIVLHPGQTATLDRFGNYSLQVRT